MKRLHTLAVLVGLVLVATANASTNVIEQQLKEIGTIPNQEVIVVQRKYTRKNWRSEITPIMFGGNPFGTIQRTLMGGASYTLHANDWLGIEVLNFAYTQSFFSSFTGDINQQQAAAGRPNIEPDYQKVLYFLSSGIQISPFYGKMATLSSWLAYVEPYFSLGAGLTKTDANSYFTAIPGIGLRVFFKEWFSMRVEFKDYIYNESPATTGQSATTRNNYAILTSLSFWLPKMP